MSIDFEDTFTPKTEFMAAKLNTRPLIDPTHPKHVNDIFSGVNFLSKWGHDK